MNELAVIMDDLREEVEGYRVELGLTDQETKIIYHKLNAPGADDRAVGRLAEASETTVLSGGIGVTLSRPKVVQALELARQARLPYEHVTTDRVLEELAHIAFANPADYFIEEDNKVRPKSLKELTSGQKRAISEVTSTTKPDGTITHKFKFHEKKDPLEKLAKYVKLYGDDNGMKLTIDVIHQELGFAKN